MKALDDIYQTKNFGTFPANSNASVMETATVFSATPENINHRITILIYYLEKINGEINEFFIEIKELVHKIESLYQENLTKQLETPVVATEEEGNMEDAGPSSSFVRFMSDDDDPLMHLDDGNAKKLRALRQSLLSVMSLTNKQPSCSISTIPEAHEEDEEEGRILEIQRTSSGDSTLTSFTFDTFPTISNRNSLPADELEDDALPNQQTSKDAKKLLTVEDDDDDKLVLNANTSYSSKSRNIMQSTSAAVVTEIEKPKKQVAIVESNETKETHSSPVRPLPPMNTPNPKFGMANVPMTPMSPYAMYGGQMTTTAPHLPISPFGPAGAVGATTYQELLAQQETEDVYELATYLREKVHCTVNDSNKYAAMLVKSGVAGVDVLRRRLQREPQYLLNLGIDSHAAMDIFEETMKGYSMLPSANSPLLLARSPILTSNANTNTSFIMPPGHGLSPLQHQHASPIRVASNNSILSCNNSVIMNNGHNVGIVSVPSVCTMDVSVETATMSMYHELQRQQLLNADDASTTAIENGMLASDIAKLYYDATQRRNTEATNSLINSVEQQQNPIAKGYLMRMYALGQGGLPQDKPKAYQLGTELLPWLLNQVETLSHSHDLTLMYLRYILGVCYSEGLGTRQNVQEALRWYTMSAEQGYPAAQAYLGHCYYTASGGVNKNLEEAAKWYKLAAKQGYAAAQCNLGICYEHGHGTKKNLNKAIHWYTLAGEQGDMNALYNLGYCYEHGLGNILPSHTKAFHFYERSSKSGHIAAQYRVGYCYYAGLGLPEPDLTKAFHYFSLSAKRGYPAGICMMGLCYEYGHGITLNVSQAIQSYQKSAALKHPPAMCYLGLCYYHGKGFDAISLPDALKWFQKSADLGCAEAQYLLGDCHYQGKGTAKNLALALKWYRLSAKQGNQDAIRALRTLFEMDEFK
jgi:TPR repeat protein